MLSQYVQAEKAVNHNFRLGMRGIEMDQSVYHTAYSIRTQLIESGVDPKQLEALRVLCDGRNRGAFRMACLPKLRAQSITFNLGV